jgi:hypothetical protein
MVRRLNAAGVRVETSDGSVISDRDLNGLVRMWSAREDTEHKRGRIRISFDGIDANGAWRGKPPWGFTTAGAKLNKRLVPTDEAREYVPQIYARVIAGESLAQVCRWLESCGVAPAGIAGDREDGRGKSGQWWPRSLGQLIRNPAYMGHAVVNVTTQQTHVWATDDAPALVDAHTHKLAGLALDGRPKRGPVLAENRCALSGAARCYRCGGPLYRINRAYLRCAGTGPARESCGVPMIRLDVAGALADDVIGGLLNPVYESTDIPGNEAEIDAALARLDFERRQVALRGLTWDAEDAERARIRAAYELASATKRIPARRVLRPTGVTYGQRWAKLDTDGRASWLRSGEVTVFMVKGEADRPDGVRDGVSLVLHWHENEIGQD